MTDHLARTRDAGTAISALHASEAAIYGRFGYGNAVADAPGRRSAAGRRSPPRTSRTRSPASPPSSSTMSGPGVAERMRACQLARAARLPRHDRRLARLLHRSWPLETPEQLRDKEPRRILFARRDGEDVGFTGLRREHKWDNARPSGTVVVGTFCGGPAARLALARRVVDLDLMGTTKLENVGVDDPLLGWVGGPRGTGDLKTWDSTWVRLVDLEAAWPLRTYEADCDVVGRGRGPLRTLERRPLAAHRTSAGAGTASRTDDAADVTLDVGRPGCRLPRPRHRRAAARGSRARAPRRRVRRAGAGDAHPGRAGAVDRVLTSAGPGPGGP